MTVDEVILALSRIEDKTKMVTFDASYWRHDILMDRDETSLVDTIIEKEHEVVLK